MMKPYTPPNKWKANSSSTRLSLLTNQCGSTLIAVLSLVIILGVFLQTIGFDKIAQSNLITSNSRMKMSRDAIAHQIENFAMLPATFRNSLTRTDNSALKNCILGTGPSLCAGDGTEYPLNMYAPSTSSSLAQKLAGSGSVGGSSGLPVLYDTKGGLCETGATSVTTACPFEVYATFKAKCPGGGASCATAESISVHYVIRTPGNLFSSAGIKDRLILSSVDKFASEIQRTAILPSPYDYVPNSIYSTTLISTSPGITTTTLDEDLAIAAALTGITDPQSIVAITNTRITDPAIAQAVSAALVGAGLSDGIASEVAYGARDARITDVTILKSYVSVLIAAGITDLPAAYTIITHGITDVTLAKQTQITSLATALTSTSPTNSTTTTTTSTTSSTTTSAVPVTKTTACTSGSTCGTTIGI
jgi:hypothetical protein